MFTRVTAFPSVTDKENTAVNNTMKSVVASSSSHSWKVAFEDDEVQYNISVFTFLSAEVQHY